jgi:hypothetical protein
LTRAIDPVIKLLPESNDPKPELREH